MSFQYLNAYWDLGNCWWRGLHLLCDHSNKVYCWNRICSFLPLRLFSFILEAHSPASRLVSKLRTEYARWNAKQCQIKPLWFSCFLPVSLLFPIMFEMQHWLLFPALEGLGHSPRRMSFRNTGNRWDMV